MKNEASLHLRAGERGAAQIKTLLVFVALAAITFVIIKIAPVYVNEKRVSREADDLAHDVMFRYRKEGNDKINKVIERIRQEYDLPEGSIRLTSRDNTKAEIVVNYSVPIDLLVTTYTWEVQHTAIGKTL